MLKSDLKKIAKQTIKNCQPQNAVKKQLRLFLASDKLDAAKPIFLLAIGKAAWSMAEAANQILGKQINSGLVVTKYHHNQGKIGNCKIIEAGHPLPDENSLLAAEKLLQISQQLPLNTQIILLLSGGGSALIEKPLKPMQLADLQKISAQLINSGADINQINTVRKHLSALKGGRLADIFSRHNIFALILSDVIGNDLSAIASGPVTADPTTSRQAREILGKYHIQITDKISQTLKNETPKHISNVQSQIIGSVETACEQAKIAAQKLGYEAKIISIDITCDVSKIAEEICLAAKHILSESNPKPQALIWGGETLVAVQGNGKGGRTQQLALNCGKLLAGINNWALLTLATDGTDGPTDAAGGIVDGTTYRKIISNETNPDKLLENNDSYHALKLANDLLITGPTGTNLNDVIVLLVE